MTSPYGQDPWQPPPPGSPPPWAPPPTPPPGPGPWGQPASPWQPWGAAPAWTQPRPNTPLAIAAAVLGILSLLSLPLAAGIVAGHRAAFAGAALLPLAAVVTGHLARRRLRSSGAGGGGLALTGLACGWPVLAILAIALVVQPHVGAALHATTLHTDPLTVPQGPQDGVPTRPDAPLQEPPTARGILTGTVRGLDDELVGGATVTVRRASPGDTSDTPTCPTTASTTTGPDGEWFLPLCQLGDGLGWSIEVRKGPLGAGTQLAYVNSGRTTTYDVHLDRIS